MPTSNPATKLILCQPLGVGRRLITEIRPDDTIAVKWWKGYEERHDALREVDRLKARIVELEEENASLREQLTAGPEWNRPHGSKPTRGAS
jgi:hypothetical protein